MLGEEHISKLLVKFSIPAIIGMMVTAIYNVVDRIFLGNGVGQLAIGGVYLNLPIVLSMMAFSMLVGLGGNSIASIRLGQNRKDQAEKILGTSFSLIILISVTLSVLLYFNLERLLVLFGASETILPYAKEYGEILVLFGPFNMIGFALNNFIRGEGNPKVAMATMFIGAISNIILDYVFIFIFDMGVKGAALATGIGQFLSFLWTIRYFTIGKSLLKIVPKDMKLETYYIKEIISLGITPFSMQLVFSLVSVGFNHQLQKYGGDLATSSMAIIDSIGQLVFMPIFGINQGLQPIVGFNYGAKKYRRVQNALRLSLKYATIYLSLGWLVMMLFPETLVGVFVKDSASFEAIKPIAVPGLRIYNSMTFMLGFQFVGSGLFQSIGKARVGFILSMTRQLIFLMPLLFILPIFLNINGIWTAMAVSDLLSTLVTTYFLIKSNFLTHNFEKDGEFVVGI